MKPGRELNARTTDSVDTALSETEPTARVSAEIPASLKVRMDVYVAGQALNQKQYVTNLIQTDLDRRGA